MALLAGLAWGAQVEPVSVSAPLFAPAAPVVVDSFRGYQQWLNSPAGHEACAEEPALRGLRAVDLSRPEGASALTPLASRLAPSALPLLADPGEVDPAGRRELARQLAQARSEAAPEVAARSAAAGARLAADVTVGPAEARGLHGQLKPLTFYGPQVTLEYKKIRRLSVERALRAAGATSRALLDELPREPDDEAAIPSEHWAPERVADRDYARLLEQSAALFGRLEADAPLPPASRAAEAALLESVRAKDADTHAHMIRVSLLAGVVALKLGLPPSTALKIVRGARLHDAGKREDDLLALANKPGRLTADERARMEGHAAASARIIASERALDPAAKRAAVKVALQHHESMDGRGYPRALAAGQISLEARIVAVADVYDALRSSRPYKRGLTQDEAVAAMAESSAKFDPDVWTAFLAALAL